jgi:hypothetical protein
MQNVVQMQIRAVVGLSTAVTPNIVKIPVTGIIVVHKHSLAVDVLFMETHARTQVLGCKNNFLFYNCHNCKKQESRG